MQLHFSWAVEIGGRVEICGESSFCRIDRSGIVNTALQGRAGRWRKQGADTGAQEASRTPPSRPSRSDAFAAKPTMA